MSINLPTEGSTIRQLFDMPAVVEMLSPEGRIKLPTLRQALSSAADMFSADKQNLLTLWQVLLILSVVRLYPSSAVEHPLTRHT